MRFSKREGRRRSGFISVVMAVICSAVVALGAQNLVSRVGERESPSEVKNVSPAGMGVREGEFELYEPVWTTAHIFEKGLHVVDFDTGLVVSYVGPPYRNPGKKDDWIGIYEHGQLDKAHRKDWDWVCPNEKESRCKSFGSAIIPAGNDGLESGKTYTVAYWADGADESSGSPAVTIDYHVPW